VKKARTEATSRVLFPALTQALTLALLSLVSPPSEAETIAIRADRMLDVRAGRMVDNAVVVVQGGRIAAVGGAGSTSPPPEAEVIELGDVTLLPGLIDAHTHLTVGVAVGQRMTPWMRASMGPLDFALQAAHNARRTLEAGFTTVREAGANDFIDVSLARAIERGSVIGPRIVPSGYQISPTGGHGDNVGFPAGQWELGPEQGIADGPEQLLRAVRYQIRQGAQVIKLTATAGVLGMEASADAPQFSPEELRTIVEEARRHRVKVAAHAHGAEGIKAALDAGVDSIEHGSMLDDEAIGQMIRQGTFLVPTAWINTGGGVSDMASKPPEVRAKGEYITGLARISLEKAIEAGVKIAVGSDSGTFPHGLNGREFAALAERGMSPLEAIRAGTLRGAELLGFDDRGALEPGLLADLIGVPGNPLEDVAVLERVSFVMKGGVVEHQFEGGAQTDGAE
jgi:imidazolonepropionase-like amidohydrolase